MHPAAIAQASATIAALYPGRHWLALGAGLCLLALASLALMRIRGHAIAGADRATFSAAKVTGNDLPNTVVFTYDVTAVTADSFFIQQSWDRTRRVRVDEVVQSAD